MLQKLLGGWDPLGELKHSPRPLAAVVEFPHLSNATFSTGG